MPPRKTHIVGNIHFKTKKALHEYTEQLLLQKGICEINKTDNDFLFFISLYSRKPSHSSFVNSICKFKISLDPVKQNKPNYVSCVDCNNNEYSFSWRACCDGCDATPTNKLKEACRTSIQHQTSDFWMNNNTCNGCGKHKSDGCEVDHVNEFSNIYKNFMEQINMPIPTVFNGHPKTSQCMFKPSDALFERTFQHYHKEHAVLQLLCKECHKRKTALFISNASNKY